MRGFFGGLILGLIVVVAGVAVLSLMAPMRPLPDVADDAPQSSSQATDSGAVSGVDPGAGDSDLVELAPTAPTTEGTAPDDLSSLAGADTQPTDKPQVGGATTDLGAGAEAPQVAGVDVNSDAPVSPALPSVAPAPPQGEAGPSAVSDPAQPAAPDVAQTGSGFGDNAPVAESSPDIATQGDVAPTTGGPAAPVAAPGAELAPDPSTVSAAAPATGTAAPDAASAPTETTGQQTAAVPVPEVEPAAPQEPVAPQQPTAPQDPAIAQNPAAPPAPATQEPATQEPATQEPATQEPATQEPATQEPTAPQIAALPQAGADSGATRPTIGNRVVPLTERNAAPATTGSASDPEDGTAPDGPPIEVYAAAFENPEGRPLMSIVLIDDNAAIGAEALKDFPYPLTFAVDVSAPDAAAKMARHRAAGFEVVAMADLPADASAQDAEVSFSVWLAALPEVVAVLEGTKSGIQGNRDASDQVTAIVGGSGLGLITQDKGLNTVQKLAVRDGVPSAIVFRDFDGAGQTPKVMRRFLDQAAFRAGQQGAVIMLGRLRPDTISALLIWGLQDRASRVALAPVSAVLLQGAP